MKPLDTDKPEANFEVKAKSTIVPVKEEKLLLLMVHPHIPA